MHTRTSGEEGEGTQAAGSARLVTRGRGGTTFRVAVTGDFEHLAADAAPWRALGEDAEVVVFTEPFRSEQETVEALREFDAVALMRERVALTRTVLEQLPQLKFIVFSGKTNDALDDEAAVARGLVVCNSSPNLDLPADAPGGKSPAELTMALLLSCTWQTGAATALIREGGWAFDAGVPLRGKTLGIIGYGDIGKPVARMGQAFGMDVMAFSRSLTPEVAQRDNVVPTDLETLLRSADVISIHVRLTPSTRGLIGAQQIAQMKDGVILINTARAQIVAEQPFLEALRSRKIGMAGLDVFWEEPLPADHPLMTLPNVVMTPHIGYATREAMILRYRGMLETLAEYRRGNVVGRYRSRPAARV